MPESNASKRLQRNLTALKQVNPELAKRLLLPVVDDHVSVGGEKDILLHYGRVPRPLNLCHQSLRQGPLGTTKSQELIVAGVGLGEPVNVALEGNNGLIHAWERDPVLLCLALSAWDWSGEIASGRLKLYLGIDCVLIPQAALQTIWAHPVLESIYDIEISLLRRPVQNKRALICAGELFVRDLAVALEDEGYSVYTWAIQELSVEELERTVHIFQPHAAFAINFTEGLADACKDFDLPLAIWEIDPNTNFLPAARSDAHESFVFTYRKARVQQFQEAGFPRATYLPLAANTTRRSPIALTPNEQAHYGAKLSFVGASMVKTALRFERNFSEQVLRCYPDASPETADALRQELLDLQRQNLNEWCIPELLEERAPGFQEACRVLGLENPNILLGEMAASEKRLNIAANLGHLGLHVWGDEGWKHLERYGAKHRGYAGHFKELSRIYCASEINIDIGRVYQSDIIPMRIFDILACGGFVIAEHNDAIEELFRVDQEIVCWKNLEDLHNKVLYFLENPEAARAIAEAGRQRVCEDHSIRQRVRKMLDTVERNFTPKRSLGLAG